MVATSTANGKPTLPASLSSKDGNGHAETKPKRPLSGYNLFYRYKRNRVLEAFAGRCFGSLDEEKVAIEAVLSSPPGLEGIPPTHPMWSLPRDAIDEVRAKNIKAAMEGNIFPNENARKRLHRKVHGIGFVEMGRMMRDKWACVDNVAKDVFCKLADVGRVRYRVLLAEWEARRRLGVNGSVAATVSVAAAPIAHPVKAKSGTTGAVAVTPAKAKASIATHATPKAAAAVPAAAAKITPTSKPRIKSFFSSGSRRGSPPPHPTLPGNDRGRGTNNQKNSDDNNRHNRHNMGAKGPSDDMPATKEKPSVRSFLDGGSSRVSLLKMPFPMNISGLGNNNQNINKQDASGQSVSESIDHQSIRGMCTSTKRPSESSRNDLWEPLSIQIKTKIRAYERQISNSHLCINDDDIGPPLASVSPMTLPSVHSAASSVSAYQNANGQFKRTIESGRDDLWEPLSIQTKTKTRAYERQVSNSHLSNDNDDIGPPLASVSLMTPPSVRSVASSVSAYQNANGQFKRTSKSGREDLWEPLSIQTKTKIRAHERQVSNSHLSNDNDDIGPPLASVSPMTPPSVHSVTSSASAHQNANDQCKRMIRGTGFPTPPLFQPQPVSEQVANRSFNAELTMASLMVPVSAGGMSHYLDSYGRGGGAAGDRAAGRPENLRGGGGSSNMLPFNELVEEEQLQAAILASIKESVPVGVYKEGDAISSGDNALNDEPTAPSDGITNLDAPSDAGGDPAMQKFLDLVGTLDGANIDRCGDLDMGPADFGDGVRRLPFRIFGRPVHDVGHAVAAPVSDPGSPVLDGRSPTPCSVFEEPMDDVPAKDDACAGRDIFGGLGPAPFDYAPAKAVPRMA